MSTFQFQPMAPSGELKELLDSLPDRTLFQTAPWLDFISRTQKVEPVFGAFVDGQAEVGWFTGFIVKKGGFRILGSPFRGWTTEYLGFNLRNGYSRAEAVRVIKEYAFRHLGCLHLELMDRNLTREDAQRAGLNYNVFGTYEVDLRRTEDEILAGMSHGRRQSIRKAIKHQQVTIEEARDPLFAEDYYAQLRDTFAKQGLLPTYGIERVKALIECLLPTGRVLLLRARDQAGNCIATGIFPASHGVMYFWGGASYRAAQKMSPNEPLQWYAMRYWKRQGVVRYDMGGGGKYKEQYGGCRLEVPWISESRSRTIARLRNSAFFLHKAWTRLRGFAAASSTTKRA